MKVTIYINGELEIDNERLVLIDEMSTIVISIILHERGGIDVRKGELIGISLETEMTAKLIAMLIDAAQPPQNLPF